MWLAKRGKFENLGTNDAYYDTHDNNDGEKKNVKKPTVKSGGFFSLNPQKVPEKQKEAEKFSFSTGKKLSIYTEKAVPMAEKPDKAPFIFVLCIFVLNFFACFALELTKLSPTGAHFLKSALYILVYALPALVYILLIGDKNKKYNIVGFSPSYLAFTFACLALLLSVTALQKYYIAYTFTYSEDMGTMGVNAFLVLISSAVLPAICEEICVHGIFQHEAAKYGGGFAGIIASSLVFAMLHFELQYFVIYLISGLILGSLTHITSSCVPAIIVHMLNNTAAIFIGDRMAYVAKERIGGTLLMIVLTLLAFVFLIIILRMAQRISESRAMVDEGVKKGTREEADFLISKSGRTFERVIKSLTNPSFLLCIAIFIIAVAVFSSMKA